MNGVFSSIYVTGSVLGLLLVATLLAHKNKSRSEVLLAALILLVAIDIGLRLLMQSPLRVSAWPMLNVPIYTALLFAPLMHLLLRAQLTARVFSRWTLLHFIFFCLFQVAAMLEPRISEQFSWFATDSLLDTCVLLIVATYLIMCLDTIRTGQLPDKSCAAFHNCKWVLASLVGMLVGYLVITAAMAFLPSAAGNYLINIMYALLSCLLLMLTYSFLHKALANNHEPATLELVKEKYGNNRLPDFIRDSIISSLNNRMNCDKPWLKYDLTLSQLATSININPHHLSQIINSEFGKSFAGYISEFRINAACELLSTCGSKTVLEIALASGFSSKSSFNTLFKKQTGLTPSEYRKQFGDMDVELRSAV